MMPRSPYRLAIRRIGPEIIAASAAPRPWPAPFFVIGGARQEAAVKARGLSVPVESIATPPKPRRFSVMRPYSDRKTAPACPAFAPS